MPVDFSPLTAPIPESPTSRGLSFVGDALDAIMARRHAVEQARLQREQAHLHAQMVDARTRDVAKLQQESNDENRRLRIAMYGETLEDKARTQRRLAAESAPKVAGQLGTASLAETLPPGEGTRIMTDYQARMKEDEDRDRLRGEPRSNSSWYTPGGNAGSGAAVVEPRPAVQVAPAVPEEGGSLDELLTLPGPVPTVQTPPPAPPAPPAQMPPYPDFMAALAETMNPGGAFSRSPPPPTPESADPPVEAPPPPLPSSKTVLPHSRAAEANALRLEEEVSDLKQDIPGVVEKGKRRLVLGEDYQKVYDDVTAAHEEWRLQVRATRGPDNPDYPRPGEETQIANANAARFEREFAELEATNPRAFNAGMNALLHGKDYQAVVEIIKQATGATPPLPPAAPPTPPPPVANPADATARAALELINGTGTTAAPAPAPPAAPVPPVSPTVPAVDPAQAAGRKAGGYNFPSRKDLVERFTETTKGLAKQYPSAFEEGVAYLWNTGDSKGAMKVFEKEKDREAAEQREIRTRESRLNDSSADSKERMHERRVEGFRTATGTFEAQNNVKELTDSFDQMRTFKTSVESADKTGDTVSAKNALYAIAKHLSGQGILTENEYNNTVTNTAGKWAAIQSALAKFASGKIGEEEWDAIRKFVKNAQRIVREKAIKAVRLFDATFNKDEHYGMHVPEQVTAYRNALKLRFGLDELAINPPKGKTEAQVILEQLKAGEDRRGKRVDPAPPGSPVTPVTPVAPAPPSRKK